MATALTNFIDRTRGLEMLGAVLFPLAILLGWQIVAATGWIAVNLFPPPSTWAWAIFELWRSGDLVPSVLGTAGRMLVGWGLASLVGVLMGTTIGASRLGSDLFRPILELARPFPASAIIPPAILIFGLTNKMAAFVIAFGATWPVLLATAHEFETLDKNLKEVAAGLEFSRLQYILKIALPAALPQIVAAARISLAIALILAVAAELQSGQKGLGAILLTAQRTFDSPKLYAVILLLGMLGAAGSYALTLVERQILRGQVLRGQVLRS